MDLATLISLVGGLAIILIGIATAGGLQTIPSYIDVPSMIITFGGAFICVFGSQSVPGFIGGVKTIGKALNEPKFDMAGLVKQIVELSNTARKDGLLALEEASNNIEDPLLKKGLVLTADGTEPELVRAILEAEIESIDGRHKVGIKLWEDIGAQGPAWGMIGTLVGLVNMLNNMSDASALGPNMAVALITTFYGSALANWVCFPVSNKLKLNNEKELTYKGVMVEGILSIQAGENPRVTEEKLKAFMSPADQAAYNAANGSGE
ncbi:motility protein A [Butyrivibrio sp. MC2013]|uniref:motility protein A n=1 Tax=Butyrivibrio sp. MC2013 TaxID=1280686 RepID=UPI0003FE3D11|nr:motility protein A [Butyrivibrio sp. MC2013]